MAKFVLRLYHGGGMPENPADVEKVMQAWGAWYTQLGAAGGRSRQPGEQHPQDRAGRLGH